MELTLRRGSGKIIIALSLSLSLSYSQRFPSQGDKDASKQQKQAFQREGTKASREEGGREGGWAHQFSGNVCKWQRRRRKGRETQETGVPSLFPFPIYFSSSTTFWSVELELMQIHHLQTAPSSIHPCIHSFIHSSLSLSLSLSHRHTYVQVYASPAYVVVMQRPSENPNFGFTLVMRFGCLTHTFIPSNDDCFLRPMWSMTP